MHPILPVCPAHHSVYGSETKLKLGGYLALAIAFAVQIGNLPGKAVAVCLVSPAQVGMFCAVAGKGKLQQVVAAFRWNAFSN